MCSDEFHILLDHIVVIWCMYTDYRRVILSDQLAPEPLCNNLVQSIGCIVTLLLFGSILHELSCIEPVPGSPFKLSTLRKRAKCAPITGAWLFLFVSNAHGDWIRAMLLIDKCSMLSDTPPPAQPCIL